MEAIAIVGTGLLIVIAAFQLALAAGAPWGIAAYGGVWEGVLPMGIRINSLVFGMVVYPLIALYVLDAGGVAEFAWLPARTAAIWVLVVFFAVGTVTNAISRSKIERAWVLVSLPLLVCVLVLALG